MSAFRVAPCVLVAGLLALSGCGGGPNLAPVEGTVTLKGQPLDNIQVEFWPEADGPRSMALTDEQGRFVLSTDDGRRKGALVGSHKVVLRDVGILGTKLVGRKAEGMDLAKGKKPRVPAKLSDPAQTPLKKQVNSGNNQIDLEVSP